MLTNIMNVIDEIAAANVICTAAHAGQTRDIGGDPYAHHCIRVACAVSVGEYNLPAIALLHDVYEDTVWTYDDLIEAGISKQTLSVVKILTRKKGETYYTYIMRINNSGAATTVKLADLNDNMRDLKEGTLRDKYRLAYHILTDGRQPEGI